MDLATTIASGVVSVLVIAIPGWFVYKTAKDIRDEQREARKAIQQVHTLVNSNLTSQMQSELSALLPLLLILVKTVDPDKDTKEAITTTSARIDVLEAQLKTRLEVTASAAYDRAIGIVKGIEEGEQDVESSKVPGLAAAEANGGVVANGKPSSKKKGRIVPMEDVEAVVVEDSK